MWKTAIYNHYPKPINYEGFGKAERPSSSGITVAVGIGLHVTCLLKLIVIGLHCIGRVTSSNVSGAGVVTSTIACSDTSIKYKLFNLIW